MPMYQHEMHTTVTTFWNVSYVLLQCELIPCWFNYHCQVWALNFAKSFVHKFHPILHYCPIIPSSILYLKCTLVWHCDPHFLSCAQPPLHCDSKVHIVCGSTVEALPDHLWSPPFCCWPIHQQCCDGPVERVYSREVGCRMLMAALWVIEEHVLHRSEERRVGKECVP